MVWTCDADDREKRGYLKCYTQKKREKTTMRRTQNQMSRPNQKGYKNEWVRKIGKKYKKTGSGRIEMAGDFAVIVNLYLWKLLKNDDGNEDLEIYFLIMPLI